jgi:hypothetical protein
MFDVNQRFGKHLSCHFQGATLKMATATRLSSESLSHTLKSSRENLRKRMVTSYK